MGLEAYEVGQKVGKGGHSYVYKGTLLATGEPVAIKKMKKYNGMAQRELRVLNELKDHPNANVVRFIEMFLFKDSAFIVFEYLHVDMQTMLRLRGAPLSEAQARTCLEHLLHGLAHLHSLGIIHRDIKPSNLLAALGPGGRVEQVKISDFGVAVLPDPQKPEQFLQEGTIWYQPPELLFGLIHPVNVHHVDAWAAGCTFAEFLTGCPLFRGDTQLAMLGEIFAVLGSPSEETWPGVTGLRCYLEFHVPGCSLETALARASVKPSTVCLALLSALLECDPRQRISAEQGLDHSFFAGPREEIFFVPPPAPAARERSPHIFKSLDPNLSPVASFPLFCLSPDASSKGARGSVPRRLDLS